MGTRLAICLLMGFLFLVQVTSLDIIEDTTIAYGVSPEWDAAWKAVDEVLKTFPHNSGPSVHAPVRENEVHCSRKRSRAANEVIEKHLMPFVEREEYQLSRKCELNPDNDFFKDQEKHKLHLGINEWQCSYCKKTFQSEKYLDQHFDDQHYDTLNTTDGKCLADVCGALHCDLVTGAKIRKMKCNPEVATKNHRLCESLADSCFPAIEGLSVSRLHDLFMRQFCDAHTCSGGQKPLSIREKDLSRIYLAIAVLIFFSLTFCLIIVSRDKNVGKWK